MIDIDELEEDDDYMRNKRKKGLVRKPRFLDKVLQIYETYLNYLLGRDIDEKAELSLYKQWDPYFNVREGKDLTYINEFDYHMGDIVLRQFFFKNNKKKKKLS